MRKNKHSQQCFQILFWLPMKYNICDMICSSTHQSCGLRDQIHTTTKCIVTLKTLQLRLFIFCQFNYEQKCSKSLQRTKDRLKQAKKKEWTSLTSSSRFEIWVWWILNYFPILSHIFNERGSIWEQQETDKVITLISSRICQRPVSWSCLSSPGARVKLGLSTN